MRALVLDDTARATIAKVIAYAMDKPWRPRLGDKPPGDNPEHVAQLNTFRAVFSFTEANGRAIYRHLSVSIPDAGTGEAPMYPNPIAVYMIAQEFGFTGWDGHTATPAPPGWHIEVDKNTRSSIVFQRVSK